MLLLTTFSDSPSHRLIKLMAISSTMQDVTSIGRGTSIMGRERLQEQVCVRK